MTGPGTEPGTDPVTDRRTPLLLGVYGTLRRGCRNAGLLCGAEAIAVGTVAGTLHEVAATLGDRPYRYPLLVLPRRATRLEGAPDASAGRVRVEVYRVLDGRMLDALDALEAYDPDDPAGSEYVRVRVAFLDAGAGAGAGAGTGVGAGADAGGGADADGDVGPVAPGQVQVYVYAGTADGLGPVLPDGDWVTHARDRA